MNKEVSVLDLLEWCYYFNSLSCNKNTSLQKHVFALWEAARFQVRASMNESMFM